MTQCLRMPIPLWGASIRYAQSWLVLSWACFLSCITGCLSNKSDSPSPPNALSIKDRSFIELNEIALPLFIDLVQNSLADKRRLLSSMSERAEANSRLAAYSRVRQTNLVNYPTPEEFVLEQVSTINHPVRSRLFRYVRLLPMHREIGWMITDASGRQLTNWTIALENQ